jgi:hypothetical protein
MGVLKWECRSGSAEMGVRKWERHPYPYGVSAHLSFNLISSFLFRVYLLLRSQFYGEFVDFLVSF